MGTAAIALAAAVPVVATEPCNLETIYSPTPLEVPGATGPAELGDVDGDGILDLVAISGSTVVRLLGTSDGTFRCAESFHAGVQGQALDDLVLHDLNGDGWLDVAATTASLKVDCPPC